MKLMLQREPSSLESTIGKLYADGIFVCVTLEDVVRPDGVKIPHETAVPSGNYNVDITFSPRFGCLMPLLTNVQGFVGVRIHWGNSAKDTDGCILVGESKGTDWISGSRRAWDALMALLMAAKARGETISLTICNAT
jgi:hypothetical protein